MLPLPLSRFLHRHPDHQIRLTVDNTANLLSRLESGALDAAIVEGYFPGENFDAIIWQREKFIPVCASGHQFSVPPATVSDLYPETLILREPGSGTREILENVPARPQYGHPLLRPHSGNLQYERHPHSHGERLRHYLPV